MPGNDRFRVYQDLTVTAVARERHELIVHVRDPGGHGHRIEFRLYEAGMATDYADQLGRWRETGRSVTYVNNGREGALIDEEEAFRRALRDEFGERV